MKKYTITITILDSDRGARSYKTLFLGLTYSGGLSDRVTWEDRENYTNICMKDLTFKEVEVWINLGFKVQIKEQQ